MQVVSIVSCAVILIVILALGFLLEPLPKACLASIIVVALTGLLGQVTEIPKLWKVSAVDTVSLPDECQIGWIGTVFVVHISGVTRRSSPARRGPWTWCGRWVVSAYCCLQDSETGCCGFRTSR